MIVNRLGVLLEDVVALLLRRVLKLEDCVWVEQVRWALATPLHLSAYLKWQVNLGRTLDWIGGGVTLLDLLVQDLKPHSTELGYGSGEIAVNKILSQTNCLKTLRSRVGRDCRNTHLRHDLEHTFTQRLDHVLAGTLRGDAGDQTSNHHVLSGFER